MCVTNRSSCLIPGHPAEREGTAAVEFAVCLPILALFVFGTIEAANAIYVQQALTSAAYEAANVATASGQTSAAAQSAANQVLSALKVVSATVNISPTVTAQTATGTTITVTCSAPLSANGVAFGYFSASNLTATVKMTRL